MLSNRISLDSVLRQNIFWKISSSFHKDQVDWFRIGVAGFSILSIITLLADYKVLLAPDGLISWEVSNANAYWFEIHPLKIATFFDIAPETTFFLLVSVFLAALLLLLLGVWPRLSAIVALLCQASFTTILSPFAYGVDIYQTVCFFLLCIFPTGYSLSVRKRQFKPQVKELQQISVRLLQLYLIITYLSAGSEKALMPNWWNGKFIYFLFNDPTIVSAFFLPRSAATGFYTLLGISVVLLETTYCIFMWIPKVRTVFFFSITLMHLFIAFFMDLTFFGLFLIILNTVCWYPAVITDLKTHFRNG